MAINQVLKHAINPLEGLYERNVSCTWQLQKKHNTCNKSDIALKEKNLGFAFRTVDKDRREYITGTIFLLQVKTTIFQQARLRVSKRHEAFISCGHLDKIRDLIFLPRTDQLKLLLTGQIMVEGGAAALSPEDFSNGEKLSSCKEVCPAQNMPMVLILKNILTAFQFFLSGDSEGVLNTLSRISKDHSGQWCSSFLALLCGGIIKEI